MTIPNIATNSLVDQTQLNQIIDTVNGISSKFANTISPIYNTTTKQVVNSYMGTFAIATNRVEVTDHKLTKASVSTKQLSVSFGKNFLAPPLVFPSISQVLVDGGGGTLTSTVPSVIVTGINQSGCTITVSIYNPTGAASDNFPYAISVMAVGLTQL
jgi:hypothetical protein